MSPDEERAPQLVVAEAARLKIALDGASATHLGRYLALVQRWGRHLNLTARPDLETLVGRHLGDALVVAELLAGAHGAALDVGAGGGLVGIPLALLRPELELGLVEANGRKCAFLRAAAQELDLKVVVHPQRLEELALPPQQVVLSRATFSPAVWVERGAPLLATGALLVCFLAREPDPRAPCLELAASRDYALADGTPRRVLLLRRPR